jgi:hypothetical protein
MSSSTETTDAGNAAHGQSPHQPLSKITTRRLLREMLQRAERSDNAAAEAPVGSAGKAGAPRRPANRIERPGRAARYSDRPVRCAHLPAILATRINIAASKALRFRAGKAAKDRKGAQKSRSIATASPESFRIGGMPCLTVVFPRRDDNCSLGFFPPLPARVAQESSVADKRERIIDAFAVRVFDPQLGPTVTTC